MKRLLLLVAALATAAVVVAANAGAGADSPGAVYTLTNLAAGNAVAVFDRAADGSLSPAGTYATGGLGTGASLGSQGAIVVTRDGRQSSVSTRAATRSRRSRSRRRPPPAEPGAFGRVASDERDRRPQARLRAEQHDSGTISGFTLVEARARADPRLHAWSSRGRGRRRRRSSSTTGLARSSSPARAPTRSTPSRSTRTARRRAARDEALGRRRTVRLRLRQQGPPDRLRRERRPRRERGQPRTRVADGGALSLITGPVLTHQSGRVLDRRVEGRPLRVRRERRQRVGLRASPSGTTAR